MKEPLLFQSSTDSAALEQALETGNTYSLEVAAGKSDFGFREWNDAESTTKNTTTPKATSAIISDVVVLEALENSKLEYVYFQNLNTNTQGKVVLMLKAEKGAEIKLTVVQHGAAQAAIEVNAECAGEGANIRIHALQNVKDSQKHQIQVHSRHPVPHTQSHLHAWCVGRDRARSIFNGIVSIEPGAHHTEAYQQNRNLILSEQATVDSFPKLFIANDDVKCAHGSTTSTLDEDQSIYLRSRGLSLIEAEQMMTGGFIRQALESITNADTRTYLENSLGVADGELS